MQISKIAAAQRQLDAAIRMFFQREDELAIHTVAAAAFQILRDITKRRGRHFTSEVFKAGLLSIAKQYVQGTLLPHEKAIVEGSIIAELAEHIRVQGDSFDKEWIDVNISKRMNISYGCPKPQLSSSTLRETRMVSFLLMDYNR